MRRALLPLLVIMTAIGSGAAAPGALADSAPSIPVIPSIPTSEGHHVVRMSPGAAAAGSPSSPLAQVARSPLTGTGRGPLARTAQVVGRVQDGTGVDCMSSPGSGDDCYSLRYYYVSVGRGTPPENPSIGSGDHRLLFAFPGVQSIPAGAHIVDAGLDAEGGYYSAPIPIGAYPLTKPFTSYYANQSRYVSWTSTGTTPWTTPGGDYDASAGSVVSDGRTTRWDLTRIVQSWVDYNSGKAGRPNDGIILKAADQTSTGIAELEHLDSTRLYLYVDYDTDTTNYTCGPAESDTWPADLTVDAGSGDENPTNNDTCPAGQQPQPTTLPDDGTELDPDPSGTLHRYYAGYYEPFAAARDGIRSNFTIHAPTVQRGKTFGHSLGEIAVESANQRQIIEIGWRLPLAATVLKPRLFVAAWKDRRLLEINGTKYWHQRRGARLAGDYLPVTGAASTREMAISHSAAYRRWYLYYGGKAIGYYDDSIWADQGGFTKTSFVQWFGEVAPGPPHLWCTAMGDGIRGTQAGSARIDDIRAVDGDVRSGPAPAFPAVHALQPLSGNSYYDAQMLGDTNEFRYGGPAPSNCDPNS